MGEIADDHLDRIDDELARGYRPSFAPRAPVHPLHRRQPERWFQIEATHTRNEGDVQYDAVVRIDVLATSGANAMKRVRRDFWNWHFTVLNP